MATHEQELELSTPAGPMRTFIARPGGDGPFPVGVVYMDAPGYREAVRDVARRYAAEGFLVAVPDLYYETGGKLMYDMAAVRAEGIASPEGQKLMAQVMSVTPQVSTVATNAIVEHLAGDAAAAPAPYRCTGFCMGARHALHALAATPDRFAAGSGIHPGPLVFEGADQSPHLELATVRGPLYLGFADIDELASRPEQLSALRAKAEETGAPLEIEVLEGTRHGFALSDAAVYDAGADERQFARTLELWRSV